MRVDCADQDLMDLVARNIVGYLFQKLQKTRLVIGLAYL